MNSEALRLLEKIRRDVNDVMNNTRTFSTKDAALAFIMADIDQLRALLSAQEPTAEHWRATLGSRSIELAKQEAK